MLFRRAKPTAVTPPPPMPAPKLAQAASYIAPGMVITGEVTVDGEVRIDGLLRGKIRAQLCVVEGKGVIEGDIEADHCVVRGRVAGPIRAYHVHLQPGADVEGDVISDTIAVDTGARLFGTVWRRADPFAEPLQTNPETATDSAPAPESEPREAEAEPAQPATSYLQNPLWSGADRAAYRPAKAARPR